MSFNDTLPVADVIYVTVRRKCAHAKRSSLVTSVLGVISLSQTARMSARARSDSTVSMNVVHCFLCHDVCLVGAYRRFGGTSHHTPDNHNRHHHRHENLKYQYLEKLTVSQLLKKLPTFYGT
jgi:hypothetical protein